MKGKLHQKIFQICNFNLKVYSLKMRIEILLKYLFLKGPSYTIFVYLVLLKLDLTTRGAMESDNRSDFTYQMIDWRFAIKSDF